MYTQTELVLWHINMTVVILNRSFCQLSRICCGPIITCTCTAFGEGFSTNVEKFHFESNVRRMHHYFLTVYARRYYSTTASSNSSNRFSVNGASLSIGPGTLYEELTDCEAYSGCSWRRVLQCHLFITWTATSRQKTATPFTHTVASLEGRGGGGPPRDTIHQT